MDRRGWNERYAATEGLLWSAQPNRTLEAEVADLTPGRALDVGCGEGRNAVWLATRGWDVTAVDFSDVAVERGTELARRSGVSVTWIVDDVLEFVPEQRAFDLVIVLYLHLPSEARRRVHQRAAVALRDGGTLLVLGHDVTNLERGYGGPQDPSILFSPEDLAADVPELTIVKADHVHRTVDANGERHVAIDALLRAVRD